jgi:hypothetical protein
VRVGLQALRYSLYQQLPNFPNTVRQVRFHRRRNAQRLVNLAEVVVGEGKSVGSPQVFPLHRERIRQPRKAAHLHSDGKVLALQWLVQIFAGSGVTHYWDLVGRPVPALAFWIVHLDLDELREVASVAQCGGNRADVGLETVG